MTTIRVAINGFGRIGRIAFRMMEQNQQIEVVAINDLAPVDNLAHLLKYDSVHGRFPGTVKAQGDHILVNDRPVKVFSAADPGAFDWGALKIDVVIESTGLFTDRASAMKHVEAGARKVIISAPAKAAPGDVKFVVLGINDEVIEPDDVIISNSSCTTNCVAPMIKILDENWGLEDGFISTVHSYTRDQNLIDAPHNDWRRGRAAAESIVPTTTGAAKAVTRIFPHLEGKLGGFGIRVPVPDGSLTDLTCTLKRSVTVEQINAAFKAAAEGGLKGILEYTEDPIVSVDILGNTHSAIFDAGLTAVLGEQHNLVKIVAWYDNECGFATRLSELVVKFA